MAYEPLEPRHGIPSIIPSYPQRASRTGPRRQEFSSDPYPYFDELPLIDMNYTKKALYTHGEGQSTQSNLAYEPYQHIDLDRNHVRDMNNHSHSAEIWSERLGRALRYVRSSGPASTSVWTNDAQDGKRACLPTGWRLGTWFCCSAVMICVILEIAMLAYAIKTSSSGKGSNILLEGRCEAVRELELWLLLPLNIAGTILIGTSNYVMQVVSAPERKEIDEAHARAQPIAVAGLRFKDLAITKNNRFRRIIWWSLGLSSILIHFLLNAAVFSSVQASNNGILVVSDAFTSDQGWDYCNKVSDNSTASDVACGLYQSYRNNETQSMSGLQCLRQYSSGFQTNASSVIVVTDSNTSPWYNLGSVAPLPSSVVDQMGLTCIQKSRPCTNYSSQPGYSLSGSSYHYGKDDCRQAPLFPDGYAEISENRDYTFTYDETNGYVKINLTFIPFCRYVEVYASETNKTVIGQNLTVSDLSSNWYLNISDHLYLREDDAVANITSVKALFSAFQFRYWGTAASTEDYLRKDYAFLIENRDPRFWLCPLDDLRNNRQCDPLELQRKDSWEITPEALPVRECHVLPKEERCTLRYSLVILVITTCFDIVKLLAMVSAVMLIAKPLTTLGDIIQSFLENPDPCTENCHLLDDDRANIWTHLVRRAIRNKAFQYCKERFGNDFLVQKVCKSCQRPFHPYREMQGTFNLSLLTKHRTCGIPAESPELCLFGKESYEWMAKRGLWWTTVSTAADGLTSISTGSRRWFQVPSPKRWKWSTFLFLPAVLLAILYFTINFQSLVAQRLRSPWSVGFEAPDPNSLLVGGLAGTTSIYTAAILINAPQVAFSMLYFIFNATLTMMHTAHEWANFAVHRKALRVSNPRGQQRATYWLQLPWTYSIPLILCSGSMHWLLSRSLYIVKVDMYGYLGERESEKDYFACGYSPIPSLFLILILALLGGSVYGLALRRLPAGMPLVRLNSLAIAAACHPDPSEKGLALKPLMWGGLEGYSKDGVRPHCSFSARPVTILRDDTYGITKKASLPLRIWPFNRKVSVGAHENLI